MEWDNMDNKRTMDMDYYWIYQILTCKPAKNNLESHVQMMFRMSKKTFCYTGKYRGKGIGVFEAFGLSSDL
jgi:hypothetical protein